MKALLGEGETRWNIYDVRTIERPHITVLWLYPYNAIIIVVRVGGRPESFPEPLPGSWVALSMRDRLWRGGLLQPESSSEFETNCSSSQSGKVARITEGIVWGGSKVVFFYEGEETPLY